MSVQMGFDTGTTHVGFAIIDPCQDTAVLHEISLNRVKDPMKRINAIQFILSDCEICFPASYDVIIEGSAFSKTYRQTELAEIRTSAALWFKRYGGRCRFISPMTIRKQVFGKGTLKAHDVWTGIEPNALAALACAFYV